MYARFGQELYTQETLTAAAILAQSCEANDANKPVETRILVGRIAAAIPHGTPATRQRIAVKLLQRIVAGSPDCLRSEDLPTGKNHGAKNPPGKNLTRSRSNSENTFAFSVREAQNLQTPQASLPLDTLPHSSSFSLPPDTNLDSHDDTNQEPQYKSDQRQDASEEAGLKAPERLNEGVLTFARLLAHLSDTQSRRELVFFAAARADTLIGAIAHEILYPYFIEERIPPPYEEDEFLIANAGLLLAPEPILTTGVVSDFARRAWGFDSERTICLALRILRQAGILLSAPLLGERGRVAAYTLAPHGLSLPTLLWGLHQEYGQAGIAPAWDQVGRAHIAQLFVVPPSVVTSRLWEAERAGLVGFWSMAGTRRVALKVREADALARLLLSGPYAK